MIFPIAVHTIFFRIQNKNSYKVNFRTENIVDTRAPFHIGRSVKPCQKYAPTWPHVFNHPYIFILFIRIWCSSFHFLLSHIAFITIHGPRWCSYSMEFSRIPKNIIIYGRIPYYNMKWNEISLWVNHFLCCGCNRFWCGHVWRVL